ncbi:MAG: sugar ABC transporter substrate-binding protein [Spirochaetes bacterium]|nr:sugar ABC transporter substrate-binding protein [Spirochaetota bacterium]
MKRRNLLMFVIAVLVLFSFSALAFAGTGKKVEKPKGKIPKRVGYVTNYAMHEWYQNVMKGMRARAEMLGIELEIIDANLDMAKEVSAAEDLMAKGVDVLIITPVEQKGAEPILKKAKIEGIPVVIEASAVEGMKTLVAICDYDCGYKGGVETGKYVKEHLGGKARILAIDLPMLRPCILRVDGFFDGIRTIVPDAELVHRLDGQGLKDHALQVSTDALTADPDINVIYGCNDDSALGALQAYRAAGLDENELVVCGTGGEGNAFIHAMKEGGPYKVEAAMFPEAVGYNCIEMAVKLYNNEEVPEHFVTPTFALTPENWDKYYSLEGEKRQINWDNVNKIVLEDKCAKY